MNNYNSEDIWNESDECDSSIDNMVNSTNDSTNDSAGDSTDNSIDDFAWENKPGVDADFESKLDDLFSYSGEFQKDDFKEKLDDFGIEQNNQEIKKDSENKLLEFSKSTLKTLAIIPGNYVLALVYNDKIEMIHESIEESNKIFNYGNKEELLNLLEVFKKYLRNKRDYDSFNYLTINENKILSKEQRKEIIASEDKSSNLKKIKDLKEECASLNYMKEHEEGIDKVKKILQKNFNRDINYKNKKKNLASYFTNLKNKKDHSTKELLKFAMLNSFELFYVNKYKEKIREEDKKNEENKYLLGAKENYKKFVMGMNGEDNGFIYVKNKETREKQVLNRDFRYVVEEVKKVCSSEKYSSENEIKELVDYSMLSDFFDQEKEKVLDVTRKMIEIIGRDEELFNQVVNSYRKVVKHVNKNHNVLFEVRKTIKEAFKHQISKYDAKEKEKILNYVAAA